MIIYIYIYIVYYMSCVDVLFPFVIRTIFADTFAASISMNLNGGGSGSWGKGEGWPKGARSEGILRHLIYVCEKLLWIKSNSFIAW